LSAFDSTGPRGADLIRYSLSLGGQAGADSRDPGSAPAPGSSDRVHPGRTPARAGDGRLDPQWPTRPHGLAARPLRASDREPPSGPPALRRERSCEHHRRAQRAYAPRAPGRCAGAHAAGVQRVIHPAAGGARAGNGRRFIRRRSLAVA